MSGRVITAAPTFITLEGDAGPISLALHNVIRFAPDKRDPENRTIFMSRGHSHTIAVVSVPHAEVAALIAVKLGGQV